MKYYFKGEECEEITGIYGSGFCGLDGGFKPYKRLCVKLQYSRSRVHHLYQINEDGSVDVTEYWTLSFEEGSFTIFYKDIVTFGDIEDSVTLDTSSVYVWIDDLYCFYTDDRDGRPDYTYNLTDSTYGYEVDCYKSSDNVSINNGRALQWIPEDSCGYECSAGKCLLIILANGDMMACRRLPFVIGNIYRVDDLGGFLEENETMKMLRKPKFPKECVGCKYFYKCGGSLCVTYAQTGKLGIRDVNCYL